jgi:hypothetical protein
MTEIWKDIPDFENLYQVSNLGNVKALSKIRKTGRSGSTIRVYEDKILKFSDKSNNGYRLVTLCNFGKTKTFTIHRLVCISFLINEFNYDSINHKDGNKLNNNVLNLEWCTKSQNSLHAFKIGLQKGAFLSGVNNVASKKILRKSDNKIYNSIKEAFEDSNFKIKYETFCKYLKENKINNYKLL